MWIRSELKSTAKAQLKANYWHAVVVGAILTFLLGSGANSVRESAQDSDSSSDISNMSVDHLLTIIAVAGTAIVLALIISLLLRIFVWNPLTVGCQKFFVNCKYGNAVVKDMGFAFKNGYYKNVGTVMFFRTLFTYLWSLLFIIPGIVKSYEYMMIPYLLAENPEMPREEAFARSKEMMQGQKWNTFVLDLSFIGWMLLGAVTCGLVALFYGAPYQYMTRAELYHTLKNQQ